VKAGKGGFKIKPATSCALEEAGELSKELKVDTASDAQLRAKLIRDQRDKIVAKKKAEREKDKKPSEDAKAVTLSPKEYGH
jgi:hypothetical protein